MNYMGYYQEYDYSYAQMNQSINQGALHYYDQYNTGYQNNTFNFNYAYSNNNFNVIYEEGD